MANTNRKKARTAKKPPATAGKRTAKAKKKATKRAPAASKAKGRLSRAVTTSVKKATKASAKKNVAKNTRKTTGKISKESVKKSAKAPTTTIAKRKTATRSPAPADKRSAPASARSAKIAPLIPWGSQIIEMVDEDAKTPKTKLTKKQLREFKRMLLDKRRELVGDMTNLTNEALSGNEDSGNRSSAPFHMADAGSDNWEQEFTFGLIENERSLVREIDEALSRIAERIYGVCLATHHPIDLARLRAKPWAKYCIEYARLLELRRVP